MVYLRVAYYEITKREDFLQKIIYPCLREDKEMGVLKVIGMFSPIEDDASELSCILVFKDLATYEEWGKKGAVSAVYKQLGEIGKKEGPFYSREEAKLLTSDEFDAIDWES